MTDRPAIPAEIRRRVLVEAGHRCAIQTCRHPEVDIHHIIPWEQCKEHNYDNLIALCPNCHRRADAEEIDRKALRLYKVQLQAGYGIPEMPKASSNYDPITKGSSLTKNKWASSVLLEARDKFPMYEVQLEYPVFEPDLAELEELNVIFKAAALTMLHEFRLLLLNIDGGALTKWMAEATSGLVSSFEVSLFNDNLISIRFSTSTFNAGAAHPNQHTSVVNYQRKPLVPLSLDVIFNFESDFLDFISNYCISQLILENGDDSSSDWVEGGASPELENFTNFNLIERGLLITFDPYHVGCYAEGTRQVVIPWHRLSEYLNPKCNVARWLNPVYE